MFQRQSRAPFPARNIIILAALILLGLVYLLKSLQEKPRPEPDPDPILVDSLER